MAFRELTEQDIAEFREAGSEDCPFCHSDDIAPKWGIDQDEVTMFTEHVVVYFCRACSRKWRAVFALARIEEVL